MIITDEMDDFITEKTAEWTFAQDSGCNCPSGNPPCGFCEGGYSLELAEFLVLAIAEEFGSFEDPHEDYNRAMKDLF